MFVSAIAYWSQTREIGFAQATLRYIMIAQPCGAWYETRNHPAEAGLRNYFCYQEISADRAQIEQLGSDIVGFFDIKGLGPDNGEFRIDSVSAPVYLDITPIKEELIRRAETGSVTSLNFNVLL